MLIARGVTETEVVPRVARKTGWKHRRHLWPPAVLPNRR